MEKGELRRRRGKFFFPTKVCKVRSIKCSALSHIRSADPVKNGTPSACFPLMGKFTDLTQFSVRIFTLMGKFPDLFFTFKIVSSPQFFPLYGKFDGPSITQF
jgi:hypothetical protein